MKAEYINPFIQSIGEVFNDMMGLAVEKQEVRQALVQKDAMDMIGVIGLSGTAKGIVALRLPVPTALTLVGRMIGTTFKTVDRSIIDGVGEIVNIVAGNAKAKFEGHDISVSLPTVVRGNMYKLSNLQNVIWIEVPFTCEAGDFSLAVTFQPQPENQKEASRESVVG